MPPPLDFLVGRFQDYEKNAVDDKKSGLKLFTKALV
jgi:hypothetical protein